MSEYYLYGDRDGNALDLLKASRPKLISQLHFWASKRLDYRVKHSLVAAEDVAKRVDRYLEAIAFSSSEAELRRTTDSWGGVLSCQEKAIVGKFFPFNLPRVAEDDDYAHNHVGGWFLDTNWYKLGDGQYITAEEEVLDGITYQGQEVAIITRNAYEAEVLNAKNMMIVDVDLEGDQAIAQNAQFALDVLQALINNTKTWDLGFRVYKTAAGLRYICTSHEWEATDPRSDKIMRNLLADDRYRALCKFQDTYRARLTPKPWRASDIAWRNRGLWDIDDDWAKHFRVCDNCFPFTVGSTNVLPQFADAIAYHDRVTGSFGDKKLILA